MKRTLVILGCVLIVVFIALSLLDRSDYAVEKKLWYLQKQFDSLADDPQAVPDKEFENLAADYKRLVSRHPQTKLAPSIYLQMGRVYNLKKDYAKSRVVFQDITKKFSKDPDVCAEALINIGWTYELEDNWPEALKVYEKIIGEYAATTVGLNVPMYVADAYQRKNDPVNAQKAYIRALSTYKEIVMNNEDSRVEFIAMRLLSSTYFALQQWQMGVETLGDVFVTYAGSDFLTPAKADVIIKTINTISLTQLQNYDIPLGIYKRFIKENPGHPLIDTLKEMVIAFTNLKQKQLQ